MDQTNFDNATTKSNRIKSILEHNLRLVAWETTKSCNLSCKHCRAEAKDKKYKDELSTAEAFELMDNIAKIGKPIVILTGGEPILRNDIFDIASYGDQLGLRMVMAPNGTLITKSIAHKIMSSGIKRISVSIDGFDSKSHDVFRGISGAFAAAVRGINFVKDAGVEFQINTTITKGNLKQLPRILKFAENIGAIAHHIFLLVPTGRGKYIKDEIINSFEYEKILNWLYEQKKRTSLQLKATCAPHYYRILRQRSKAEGKVVSFKCHGLDAVTRGCLAGIGFCFVSYKGVVKPCGYTNVSCGDLSTESFQNIWELSSVFAALRDLRQLGGKCKKCEYARVCGGCRARAFEATGDYMNEEPLCSFQSN